MTDSFPVHLPERLQVGSERVDVQATGAVLAIDVRMPAGGGPPALHRHAPAEIYRVLDGELALYVEDDGGEIRRHALGPGDVVAVPGGREHTVRNESAGDAHAYVVFAPGEPMERFIRAAATLADGGPPSASEVLAVAEAHGVQITRPIPAG